MAGQHDVAYVLASKCNDTVITESGERRADALVAGLEPQAWRAVGRCRRARPPRLRVGAGADPDRLRPGRGHWLLARRPISNPGEIAYYVCYGPRRSALADLTRTAGSRWRIEECFQQAKDDAGLDDYQVRTFRAWYAHLTLSMLALAWLAATRAQAARGDPAPATST